MLNLSLKIVLPIDTFEKTEDGRYFIELKGLIRFEKLKEINTNKKYREYEVNYKKYFHDLIYL